VPGRLPELRRLDCGCLGRADLRICLGTRVQSLFTVAAVCGTKNIVAIIPFRRTVDMTLEHQMTHHLKTGGPLGTTEGAPIGARQYWEMSELHVPGRASTPSSGCLVATG
jgi:hypothetical protein